MFAGPNGSGKTTIQREVSRQFPSHFLIISRYYRSLGFVRDAIRHTDRAYFFDTSEPESLFVAESAGGNCPELRCDSMPIWFKHYIWDKF